MTPTKILKSLRACTEAIDWSTSFDDPESAWAACNRSDWMLWFAGKHSGAPWSDGRRPLVLAACECARLSLKYVREGELRPLRCIEIYERWARGESIPNSVLRNARNDANAAYATYAAAAANAAANAAYAAAKQKINLLALAKKAMLIGNRKP